MDPTVANSRKTKRTRTPSAKATAAEVVIMTTAIPPKKRSKPPATIRAKKSFVCDSGGCGKECRDKHALTTHMRTHTGETPYKCVECDWSFAQSSHLKQHMRTHTGEKPYKCVECDWSFAQSSHLKQHMRTHTGEKPYKCVECDKIFALNGNLIRHMRTHTGKKPYKCVECDKAFALNGNLKRHFNRHHTQKGQATRKREEQRVWLCLESQGYKQAAGLGDAAPPAEHFCREKLIDFRCAGEIDAKYARIDFVINPGGGKSLIFLEVDEDQHRFGYGEAGCDMKRVGKVMESLLTAGCEMRIVWLRYNPGSFKVNGISQDAARKPSFSHYKKIAREQWGGSASGLQNWALRMVTWQRVCCLAVVYGPVSATDLRGSLRRVVRW